MLGYIALGIGVAFVLFRMFGPRGDPTAVLDNDDPRLIQAVDQARNTLPLFVEKGLPDTRVPADDKAVKVRFSVPFGNGNTESIWVGDVQADGASGFTGVLDNNPVHIADKRIGDTVQFDQDQIVDWSWLGPDERVYGHYSTRLMMKEHPVPRGAEGFAEALSEDPVPADWRQ